MIHAARVAALAVAVCGSTFAAAAYGHPLGHTTEDHSVNPGAELRPGFHSLAEGPGWPRVTRALPKVSPMTGRVGRRRSLAYFGQLTDFQLADEESPARVELTDPGASSAWRPQEAFHPWVIDWSFRQLNRFTSASPHRQAGAARVEMDFALLTGDQSDNQQYNETLWVRQLVEGGEMLDPNSGVDPAGCDPAAQAALAAKPGEAKRYTGVQDYSDYPPGNPDYYDPNQPTGSLWENWPTYTGLMDRAQRPFVPVGLRSGEEPVPTYVTNGNHDGLVQGNEDAIAAFEAIAVGCFKPFTALPAGSLSPPALDPDPNVILGLAQGFFVPPDPARRLVDRIELKRIYRSGAQRDDHGFAYIDPSENAASGYAASYYAWDAKPGLRFISIDTVSDGGVIADSSNGNIDDPQWRWLQRELDAATKAGKLVVVFGHHPVRSLTSLSPDELAQPCTGRYSAPDGKSDEDATYGGIADGHGHDLNPGCDLDPRISEPIHDGADLVDLLSAHPHVVAYVAGHTHENKVLACGREEGCPEGGNWWEINTAATADWPQQHRLIELMDNADGTLSILATLLDHGSKLDVPADGLAAEAVAGLGDEDLAAIGRVFSYNDPHADRAQPPDTPTGAEGEPQDRNVELLVDDPRRRSSPRGGRRNVLTGTRGDDVIVCTAGDDLVRAGAGDDVIRCGRGDDIVFAGAGDDRVFGQHGRDRLFGGPGSDRLAGESGADRLHGGPGPDRLFGGSGADLLLGSTGADAVFGGPGRDRIRGGPGRDRTRR